MSPSPSRRLHLPKRGTYAALLLALVLVELVSPVVEDAGLRTSWLAEVFFLFVLFSSLAAAVEARKRLVSLIVLGLVGELAGLGLAQAILGPNVAFAVSRGARVLFLVVILRIILRHVLGAQRVSTDLILGALCAYLILGLVFGVAYEWITVVHPAAFRLPAGTALGPGRMRDVPNYFSLVTLTTLGYGDVVPASPLARSLATFEAFLGQIFVAVVIARLVAVHVMQGTPKADR